MAVNLGERQSSKDGENQKEEVKEREREGGSVQLI